MAISIDRIVELAASAPDIDTDAVWNFLGTLDGETQGEALGNLSADATANGWNTQTVRAIEFGIHDRGEP